jgi:Ca2+-binding RTX toxin-like protein
MATSVENGTPVNIGEIVHVTAMGYADKIKGNASDNIIHGGGGDDWISGGTGADALFGGGADDFIFFDAEDTGVNGGAGRDVAVAVGQTGVAVNMAAQDLEVVIGSDGADVITGIGGATRFAAGGAGADSFSLTYDDGDGPTVLWGGAGSGMQTIRRVHRSALCPKDGRAKASWTRDQRTTHRPSPVQSVRATAFALVV